MTKFITPGTVTGVLAIAGAVAFAFHQDALASFFNDPTTATAVSTVLIGAAGLVAGFLKGITH